MVAEAKAEARFFRQRIKEAEDILQRICADYYLDAFIDACTM
jgi:hypothetical protein